MIDVINLQRKVKLETAVYKEYVKELASSVEEADGKTFSVAFVSDDRMWKLNWSFRGKDSTTDVLSFPHEADEFEQGSPPYEGGVASVSDDGVVLFSDEPPSANSQPPTVFLGDIVISAEQAQTQAKENKLTLENEIKQLILHGLLHLCGYDHETDKGEMNKRELALRKKLKIN